MTILYILGAFVLGCLCVHYAHKHGGGNLTTEQFAQCVQIALSDPAPNDIRDMKELMDDIGEYALGFELFEELSPEAQDIVRRCRSLY